MRRADRIVSGENYALNLFIASLQGGLLRAEKVTSPVLFTVAFTLLKLYFLEIRP